MPRPQTARRLLREMTSLGVDKIWFSLTDRSEKGYASSKLWSTGEYRRHLVQGAEQAFCTRIPEVRRFESINDAIASLGRSESTRIALDNYESTSPFRDLIHGSGSTVLAIGAERGWSAHERDTLRKNGFEMADLGKRVLRVETAAIAAVSVILALTD